MIHTNMKKKKNLTKHLKALRKKQACSAKDNLSLHMSSLY